MGGVGLLVVLTCAACALPTVQVHEHLRTSNTVVVFTQAAEVDGDVAPRPLPASYTALNRDIANRLAGAFPTTLFVVGTEHDAHGQPALGVAYRATWWSNESRLAGTVTLEVFDDTGHRVGTRPWVLGRWADATAETLPEALRAQVDALRMSVDQGLNEWIAQLQRTSP